MDKIGLVAIGRNEGDRLQDCLVSVMGKVNPVVYVDSGSSDRSVEMARSLGAEVVELDLSIPFTAARARNAGFNRLLQVAPETKFVQFVDGDCEVVPGWLEKAAQELDAKPDVAVVCGRRRERFPEESIYNKMCDIEWDRPIGETKYCGGDSMMRVEAFQQVEGFNPTLIAGEEPELCVRLRQKGWKIFRIDAEMTLHDAQMTRFDQWWKRTLRSGHAYAEGAWLHGKPPERHWVKNSRSSWFWGLILPLLALGISWPSHGFALLLLAGYPVLSYRIYSHYMQAQGLASQDAALNAVVLCDIVPGTTAGGIPAKRIQNNRNTVFHSSRYNNDVFSHRYRFDNVRIRSSGVLLKTVRTIVIEKIKINHESNRSSNNWQKRG